MESSVGSFLHVENTLKKISTKILAAVLPAVAIPTASVQAIAPTTEHVTVENYNRAQTDVNFAGVVKAGGFRKFQHGRDLAPLSKAGSYFNTLLCNGS
jgi:hypothetical protein